MTDPLIEDKKGLLNQKVGIRGQRKSLLEDLEELL